MKKIYTLFALSLLACAAQAQTESTADFEDLTYADGLDYETGEQLDGGFKSGAFYFVNKSAWADYGEWGKFFTMDGFCYSKRSETTFDSMTYDTDQFNNQVGAGAEESEGFAVSYGYGSTITADYTFKPTSCYITNNAYVLNSVMNGDAYARRFNYDDVFTLTITGYKDKVETASVDVELASKGSVIFQWVPVDLSTLGEVDSVVFTLKSTDNGDYGMNTPAYFCLDNFKATLSNTPVALKQVAVSNNAIRPLYDLMGRQVRNPRPGTLYIK